MDVYNERKVFECITQSSCGRKLPQYFLVTPKLITGLTFHRDTQLLFILSGPYNHMAQGRESSTRLVVADGYLLVFLMVDGCLVLLCRVERQSVPRPAPPAKARRGRRPAVSPADATAQLNASHDTRWWWCRLSSGQTQQRNTHSYVAHTHTHAHQSLVFYGV